VKKLKNAVSLADIKANTKLRNLLLVRQSRLSVMPVGAGEFEEIIKMGRK
jgi:predicted RNA-binding protein with PUA-like domain